IPARLRWTTPFGQMTEVCETLNVSRGGLLVPCKENHATGISLWVTFPFDATVPFGQPEVLARVVRSSRGGATGSLADGTEAIPAGGMEENDVANASHNGAWNGASNGAKNGDGNGNSNESHGYAAAAALRFEIASHPTANGNGHRELERRTSPRRAVAVPIRIWTEHVPWFEETMTLDVSRESVR